MLDKIAMITFLVVYIIFLLITIFMYLVIVGTDKCKTDEERIWKRRFFQACPH